MFERGTHYAESDAVRSLVWRGKTLAAEVFGSDWKPYRVRVTLRKSGIAEARCSCPYD